MYDFCIELYEKPENLALIGEMLGSAGVNIDGLCLIKCGGRDIIHFVVEDVVSARRVLESSGVEISDVSEVFVLHKDRKQITGKPGSFGGICRALTGHGVKINFGYPAEHNRFIFGVDDVAKAHELLE